ncbi:uncharacterized protein [Equus asinus]|uniref:uncharacterized protein n=1 Tax=Equus asinus TaxID=9793 RepID=UPI0038F70841
MLPPPEQLYTLAVSIKLTPSSQMEKWRLTILYVSYQANHKTSIKKQLRRSNRGGRLSRGGPGGWRERPPRHPHPGLSLAPKPSPQREKDASRRQATRQPQPSRQRFPTQRARRPSRQDPGDGLVLPQGFSSHGFASMPTWLQRAEGTTLRSRRPVTTEMHRPRRRRHRSCCWILPTARRPLPPPPPQEPRKQSAAVAAAVLWGRGSGRRGGAASLCRVPSSTGSLRRGAGAYWLRRHTFVGGLLLRRSTSFDPVYLVVGGPGYRVLCFPRCFIYNSQHATMLKNINPRPSG